VNWSSSRAIQLNIFSDFFGDFEKISEGKKSWTTDVKTEQVGELRGDSGAIR
jgi:hypothetical protein